MKQAIKRPVKKTKKESEESKNKTVQNSNRMVLSDDEVRAFLVRCEK